MTDYSQSKYKWYILALGTATHMLVVAMPQLAMPVLFKEISDDIGLSLVQIGTIWGLIALPNLFAAFIAGLVSDRFGTRRTLVFACLLQGVAGALRGISQDFTSLAVYTFLFGLFSVPLQLTTHKAAGEWFSGRQLGLANGILSMGMGVGNTLSSMTSATILSPLLGGWRNVIFAYGAITLVISLLWLQAKRQPSQAEAPHSTEAVPFRQSLSHVIGIREMWLLAFTTMFLAACTSGFTGYLPLYRRQRGWTGGAADGALATFSVGSMVGVIPLSLLSDRVGLRKAVFYPVILITIIGVGLMSVVSGVAIWPLVILLGSVRQAWAAISITMVIEAKRVSGAYAGTALGLRNTVTGLGNFFGPPVGNSIATINPGFGFIFWSALALAALLVFHFVEETGWGKGKAFIQTD